MCSIFVWRWCGSFSGMITMSIVLNLYKNIESSLCVIFIEVLLKFWCLACLSPVLGIWRGYLRHLIAHHNNMTNLPSRLCNLFTLKNDPYLLPQYFSQVFSDSNFSPLNRIFQPLEKMHFFSSLKFFISSFSVEVFHLIIEFYKHFVAYYYTYTYTIYICIYMYIHNLIIYYKLSVKILLRYQFPFSNTADCAQELFWKN